MDKKDLISFFQEIRLAYGDFFNNTNLEPLVEKLFEETDITPLDVKRMYRFLDKNAKQDILNGNLEMDDDDINVNISNNNSTNTNSSNNCNSNSNCNSNNSNNNNLNNLLFL